MDVVLILFIVIISLILIIIIYRYIEVLYSVEKFNLKIPFVSLILSITFCIPYVVRGGLQGVTREFYLIDIGVSLCIISCLMLIKDDKKIKFIVILLVTIGFVVNQGLFYNYVICGDLLEEIDTHIQKNSDLLQDYDYIYFNTSSFMENMPNTISNTSILHLFSIGLLNKIIGTDHSLQKTDLIDPGKGYSFYYNANALDKWALLAMIREQKPGDVIVIYDSFYGFVPINITDNEIIYREVGNDTVYSVNKDEVLEINYSSVNFTRPHLLLDVI
jgi:hypothetical protein